MDISNLLDKKASGDKKTLLLQEDSKFFITNISSLILHNTFYGRFWAP